MDTASVTFPLLQITWVKRRDRRLLTVGTSTHSIDNRFVVMHSSTDWSLHIRAVTVQDAGLYECQVQQPLRTIHPQKHPPLLEHPPPQHRAAHIISLPIKRAALCPEFTRSNFAPTFMKHSFRAQSSAVNRCVSWTWIKRDGLKRGCRKCALRFTSFFGRPLAPGAPLDDASKMSQEMSG